MNIFVFAANWFNRGDESAIRAMIDEIKVIYPSANFKIHFTAHMVASVPYKNMEIIPFFGNVQRRFFLKRLCYKLSVKSCGKINLMPKNHRLTSKQNRFALKKFIETVQWCDLAIYAPGGPCIGDIYRAYSLLDCIDIIRHFKKPYVFFAPSMGPFKEYKGRIADIVKSADVLCLREEISADYVRRLVPDIDLNVTLDSAFQHPIDEGKYEQELYEYTSLFDFLKNYDKVIGVTVADLQSHSLYMNTSVRQTTENAFKVLLAYLQAKNYGVVFIPQLFGEHSDKEYMASFAGENCFVVDDLHDCYFQQYLISRLYAVIGMRYHSNIFSAKMGTPFLSISYEQKMFGFVKKVGLLEYCLTINNLTGENLITYFEKIVAHYDEYKSKLLSIRNSCREESYKTTQYVQKLIEKKKLNG